MSVKALRPWRNRRKRPGGAAMGWGYWSTSPCHPRVWWWKEREDLVYYWLEGWSEARGYQTVYGSFLETYKRNGYECGFLRAPLTDRYRTSSGHRQDFEGGYVYSNFTA